MVEERASAVLSAGAFHATGYDHSGAGGGVLLPPVATFGHRKYYHTVASTFLILVGMSSKLTAQVAHTGYDHSGARGDVLLPAV